jgi:TRAP-type C4-dicarboxylate transport system substrate-binding protein
MKIKKAAAFFLSAAMFLYVSGGCSKQCDSSDSETTAAVFRAGESRAAGGEFDERNVILVHPSTISLASREALRLFADEIYLATGGKMTVEIREAQAGEDAASLLEKMEEGSVQMALVGTADIAVRDASMHVLSAPFAFRDYDHAHKTADRFLVDFMNESSIYSYNGMVLALFDRGFHHMTAKGAEVADAESIKGLRICVPGEGGLPAVFEALEAEVLSVSNSEKYDSLAQGLADASEGSAEEILAGRYYECQDRLILTRHSYEMEVLVVNNDYWNTCWDELKDLIRNAAYTAGARTRELVAGGEADRVAELEAYGMSVSEIDRDSLAAKMEPVYETLSGLSGQEAMDVFLAAVKENR